MYLHCTNTYLSRKFGVPKMARGGVEGWRKVPKVVPVGGLRGLVPEALLLWVSSRSIFRVKASFLDKIEEEDKKILQRKWISESDLFDGLLLESKSMLKPQNSPPDVAFLIRAPRSGSNKINRSQREIIQVLGGHS